MAGVRALMKGGTAVDAAVTAAAVLNVVEPVSTGMGGDLFALVWTAADRRVHALNASGRAPAAASAEELRRKGLAEVPLDSPMAITVPGTVSGWNELISRHGQMTLSDALQPAIDYADQGYPVSEVIAGSWAESAGALMRRPSGAELLPGGRPPKPGEVVRLPQLADSLRTVAEGGAAAFYRGPLAERVATFVQENGGWLSRDDMAGHTASRVEPLSTEYRGVTCWECPPNAQGLSALMALNLAEQFDLSGMGFQSLNTYHHLIECMRLAMADGGRYIADPEAVAVPADSLLAKTYVRGRSKFLRPDEAIEHVSHGSLLDNPDTVYVSAVDGQGKACSLINSIYMGFGSGLVVPGTGIALHNRGASFSLDADHPNVLDAKKRPFHTIIPGMATRNGELWLSYGVMGALQQAQGHLQVLVGMIDFGLSPQAALDASRFRTSPNDGTFLEDLVPSDTVEGLADRGHRVTVAPPHPTFFGSGQIVERIPDTGVLRAGSDPRADGFALGW